MYKVLPNQVLVYLNICVDKSHLCPDWSSSTHARSPVGTDFFPWLGGGESSEGGRQRTVYSAGFLFVPYHVVVLKVALRAQRLFLLWYADSRNLPGGKVWAFSFHIYHCIQVPTILLKTIKVKRDSPFVESRVVVTEHPINDCFSSKTIQKY